MVCEVLDKNDSMLQASSTHQTVGQLLTPSPYPTHKLQNNPRTAVLGSLKTFLFSCTSKQDSYPSNVLKNWQAEDINREKNVATDAANGGAL